MNKTIAEQVNKWKEEILLRREMYITADDLAETLADSLAEIGVSAEIILEDMAELEESMYAIGGEFDPSDPFHDVRLRFYFSTDIVSVDDLITTTDEWMTHFATEVANVTIHEYQHHVQDALRGDVLTQTAYKYASNQNQRYLGDSDEIDAYAYSIAYTLTSTVGIKTAIDLLKKPKNITATHCPDLHEYTMAFDHGHEVLRRLFKKVAVHLTT